MEPTTEIQATEDLTLSGDHAAASADSLVVDNANDNAGQEEGFEIVLKDDETAPKQDPAKNAEFARRRIERKRQRELEQQMEAVKRGELPESLRVNPDLPPQPDINAYLSEEGLAKYDYDNSRALAAFNAANTEWLMKAQDARSNAVAEQGRKTQEFTQQSAQYVEAA
ncbi:scaffolding protein, partial [Salmonella enterica subsp. enterica serovar Minnesota]|nr:scaffolding protein [Salmonella enterica subsp. enterica serovar Minnesota]